MESDPGLDYAAMPMVKVDEALTQQVATLSRLALTSEEVRTFTAQLSTILGYVDLLQEVSVRQADGSEIEPMTTPIELEQVFREDEVVEFPRSADGKPKVLASAPDVMHDGFKVPQIVG